MHYKIKYLPPFIIAAFVIGFIALMKGCLGEYDTYGVVGWPATSADSKITAAVTVENKTTSYTKRGGFTAINYASTYSLTAYENATGKLLKRKELVALTDLHYKPLRAYGGYNNLLWVFADGLKAFDINTLEEVVNEEKLAAHNPFIKNKFPREQQFIQSFAARGFIRFTATDGIKYQLDLTSLTIKPQEEETDNMAMLASFKLNPFFMDDAADFGVNADTLEGKLYALTASVKNISPGMGSIKTGNTGNERMTLYRLPYSTKSFGQNSFLNFSDTTKLNSDTYINGNFLRDHLTGIAMHLSSPAGFLLLHKDIIGDKASVIITRIDTENKKIWEANTGLSTKISYCAVSGNYCVVAGQVSADKSPFQGSDGFKIINMENGNLVNVSLK